MMIKLQLTSSEKSPYCVNGIIAISYWLKNKFQHFLPQQCFSISSKLNIISLLKTNQGEPYARIELLFVTEALLVAINQD